MKIAITLNKKKERKRHHERERDSGKGRKIPPFSYIDPSRSERLLNWRIWRRKPKEGEVLKESGTHGIEIQGSVITNNDKVIACFPSPSCSFRYLICIHPYDVMRKHHNTESRRNYWLFPLWQSRAFFRGRSSQFLLT